MVLRSGRIFCNGVIISTLVPLAWSFISNKSNWPFLSYEMYSSALNVHGVIQYKFAAMDEGKKLTEIPVSAIRSYEYFAERNFFYILTIRKKNPAQFRMILDDVRKNLKPSVSTLQFQRMVVVEKRYLQENFQAPLKLVDQRVLE